MTDDEKRANGGTDPLVTLLGQLRGMGDQLAGLGKLADALPLTAALRQLPTMANLPGVPATPGAVTAAQISAIATAISAQRSSVQAMQSQLAAFEEQLALLEKILAPFAEWSGAWADLERRFTPGASSSSGSASGSAAAPASDSDS